MGGRHRDWLRKEKVMKVRPAMLVAVWQQTTWEEGKGWMTLSAVRAVIGNPLP